MPKIREFLLNKDQYKVDTTYQRPPDAWSKEDKQCLIDTILRGEPIPLFFLNYNSDDDIYFIVDGQQRLDAIKYFHSNEIKLNKKYSGPDLHGRSFINIPPMMKERFYDFDLKFHIMKDYDDERVRLIFSRLQRGKPLQLGERLNAAPGEIVNTMRAIAKKKFLTKSVGLYKERYGVYPDAARILFYEKYGAKQCGSNELYNFFADNENLSIKSDEYKKAVAVLNILEKCFPPDPGDYKYFEKHSWVIAVYTVLSELINFYVFENREEEIRKFVRKFHALVYKEDFRKSNYAYQKYYDVIRGGWSEKLMKLRRDILMTELLSSIKLKEKDIKRQITNDEKLSKYSEIQECEYCHEVEFKDYKEGEYHHIEYHSKGGQSKNQNIMLLCKSCHKLIHGKGQINYSQIVENGEDED